MTFHTRPGKRWRHACLAVAMIGASILAVSGATTSAKAAPAATGLEQTRAALAQRLVSGTSVGIDPVAGQVVLTVSDTATGTAGLLAAARGAGSTVRIERAHGAITTMAGHIDGGNGITDPIDGVSCTLAFNVTGGFALTAGHCARLAGPWFKSNTGLFIGPAVDSHFPGTDFGRIQDTGAVKQPGVIQAYDAGVIPVTGAGIPFLGEFACHAGAVSLRQCGPITALNVSIDINGTFVSGLIQAAICGNPGDSGAPLYDDSGGLGATALGILSAGMGNCPSSGITYYQPIMPVLNFYNVRLITS
jgi:hypothetical protein